MTQIDIYTVEARRRLAEALSEAFWPNTARALLKGEVGIPSVAADTLAATLRELNWQPPVDPDEEGARLVMEACGWGGIPTVQHAQCYSSTWQLALAAYRAGKAAGGAA